MRCNVPCLCIVSPYVLLQRTARHCSSCLLFCLQPDLIAHRAHSEPGWPSARRLSRCQRPSVVCCYLKIKVWRDRARQTTEGGSGKGHKRREETKGEEIRISLLDTFTLLDSNWLNQWHETLLEMAKDKQKKNTNKSLHKLRCGKLNVFTSR